jgi:hypothetical protein
MKIMYVLLLAIGMMACTKQKVEVKYYDSDNNFRGTSRLDSVVKKDTIIQFWYKGNKTEWRIKPK